MLVKATVTKWETREYRRGQAIDNVFLFNTNRINSIRTRATSKSSFYFTENLYDRRDSPRYVETDSTAASIRTASDSSFLSNFITVLVYPNNDSTETPVLHYIRAESISFCHEDKASENIYGEGTRTWIIYHEGAFRARKVLAAIGIDQLLAYADTSETATPA